ncbi:MAG: RepB family plasmid replication initiator protein [Pseudomonadota bacterium]|nr:RepB family plasmid replication initiator protein [Pseudomonadota bacterium]
MDSQLATSNIFGCDLFEALPFFKDDMASMEHPVFSLSHKPGQRGLRYEHNGNTILIKPGQDGLPTIHDKDILIYAASYLRAAMNDGVAPSRTLRFVTLDFLTQTGKRADGDAYERFKAALDRLSGVRIKTNIKTGKVCIEESFGLIDAWRAVSEESNGRIIAAEIDISKWFYNSVLGNELLTISPEYFGLRSPLERRIYELARKHCGTQVSCKIGLDKLHAKTGSSSTLREFRRIVRRIVADNGLPDYSLSLTRDILTFRNRQLEHLAAIERPPITLRPETYEKARLAAPGWDIYALEQQWRAWVAKKKEPLKRPDSAFIAFCRKKGACP